MPASRRVDWKRAAVELATALPVERLHPECRSWAAENQKGRWLIAFSGGADSLALLLLIWGHFPRSRRRLVAAHFNHRLRGRAATADEKFCERVCYSLGVPLRVARWETPPVHASEADARLARHAFFGEALKSIGSHALWLGHQQDDIAETMLMRIARGSGTGGLSAPRPVQHMPDNRMHLRPLLSLSKSEIVTMLTHADIAWREDATNAGPSYLRNRIRSSVIPPWLKAAGERDALAGAALSRELLAEDDEALEAAATKLGAANRNGSLSLRRLTGVSKAIVRRALHRWLLAQQPAISVSRQAFNALLTDILRQRVTRHSLGAHCFAVISKTSVTLVTQGK